MDYNRILFRYDQAEKAKTAFVTWFAIGLAASTLYFVALALGTPWYWLGWAATAGLQIGCCYATIGSFKLYCARRANKYARAGYKINECNQQRLKEIEERLNSAR